MGTCRTYPCLDAAESLLMPHMPVGFAITWVTLTKEPFGSLETATEVKTGGTEREIRPAESVVETNTGDDKVVSGASVIVLTDTLELLFS